MKTTTFGFYVSTVLVTLVACADNTSPSGKQPRQTTGQAPTGSNSSPVNPLDPAFQQQSYQNRVGSQLPPVQPYNPIGYTAPTLPTAAGAGATAPTLFNDQVAKAAGDIFSNILGGLFGGGSKNSATPTSSTTITPTTPTTPTATTPTTTTRPTAGSTGGTTLPPAYDTPPAAQGPVLTTGSDACNDPANSSFPSYPEYKITRKDGYMTVQVKSIDYTGYTTMGTPISRFSGYDSADYQAMFQSGYIYKGASQYNKAIHLGLVVVGGSMKAVVSWLDGTLKHVGDVEGYSSGTALPKVVTVRFGHGACLVQYGGADGLVSGGAGYLLVP